MTALKFAGLSDAGKKHPDNDDRWHVDTDLELMFLTDGMGEAITPQFVIETLPQLVALVMPPQAAINDAEAIPGIRGVVAELNLRVRKEAPARGEITGATLVLAMVRGSQLLVAHLGDSRAYRFRAGLFEPLTIDHSYLQQMVDNGWISPEEAVQRRGNGGPTRFLGMPADAQADVRILDWRPGDRLLLCSDGLTEMLTDTDIHPLLMNAATPEGACRELVAAALDAGSGDNVTTVVAFAEQESRSTGEDAILP